MFHNLLAGLIVLAAPADLSPVETYITVNPNDRPILIAGKKEDYDPGKEITDDPHGPSPYGKNPHGRDPYDEIHDKELPANNPDKYFND